MREDREPFWLRHPVMALSLVLAGMLALGGIGWGLKVALSPVKGAGDVIIEQNDADNMIGAQKELVRRYEGLPAACARIGIAKAATEADPTDRIAATNYTAAKMHYVTLVAEYNAATQQLLIKNMLGDLPERVSANNCPGASS